MLGLRFEPRAPEPLQVLCLGAHADDIEIGCGGTVLALRQWCPRVVFHWIVFTAAGDRRPEAVAGASLFAADCTGEVILRDFRDGYLPYYGREVKDLFEEIKTQVHPDIVFTHWQGDAHQDHRLISELTANTFRDHLILEYEIPKYDGDLGRPNVFVPLASPVAEEKIDHLFTAFPSQQTKRWFDRQTFRGLMRLRGMESNAPSGLAEGFYARKAIVELPRAD